MTLKETLAALDAKATPGEWEARPVKGYAFDEVLARDDNGNFSCVMDDHQVDYSDAPFIVTLVNAYRTGQLVVAPSVEDIAADIACNSPSGLQYPWHTAAALQVLTSMGAKTDG